MNIYPYTDYHELNLDYVLDVASRMEKVLEGNIREIILPIVDDLVAEASYDAQTETIRFNV